MNCWCCCCCYCIRNDNLLGLEGRRRSQQEGVTFAFLRICLPQPSYHCTTSLSISSSSQGGLLNTTWESVLWRTPAFVVRTRGVWNTKNRDRHTLLLCSSAVRIRPWVKNGVRLDCSGSGDDMMMMMMMIALISPIHNVVALQFFLDKSSVVVHGSHNAQSNSFHYLPLPGHRKQAFQTWSLLRRWWRRRRRRRRRLCAAAAASGRRGLQAPIAGVFRQWLRVETDHQSGRRCSRYWFLDWCRLELLFRMFW